MRHVSCVHPHTSQSGSCLPDIHILTRNSANENALRAHKRTIQPKDVLDALSDLEFEGFLPRLEAELASTFTKPLPNSIETLELIVIGYTEIQTDKRNTYRNKLKAADKTAPNGETKSPQAAEGDDTPPPAKKARRSGVSGTNGHPEGPLPDGVHSGDETVTDEEGDQEPDEAEESEEDVEDGVGEDIQVGDETLEELDTQVSIPPEDEALDNGDDSD
jgi:DNA polymerase epsilon subunit 3